MQVDIWTVLRTCKKKNKQNKKTNECHCVVHHDTQSLRNVYAV